MTQGIMGLFEGRFRVKVEGCYTFLFLHSKE